MRKIMLVALFGLGACGQNATAPEPANTESATPATPTSDAPAVGAADVASSGLPKVTKAEVAKLKEGMTYDEVKAILGRDGEKGTSEHGTESISWANNDGSSLQTTFKDGKLAIFTDFGM
jgi:hypothetical protein